MIVIDWPESLQAFENFLQVQGLVCRSRGIVPRYGEKLALYGNDQLAVRVLSERSNWFTEISDVSGRPSEWYDPAILRDLFTKGSGEDVLPIDDQFRLIEENWSAISEAFSPNRREQTHEQLALLRHERAKRRFPGWEW